MANQALFGPRFDRQSQYRDRLAAQLIAEGSDASPIQHPLQGAARLAQALAGGYIGMKQDQRYAEREKQSSEAMANLFAPTQQFTPSAAGAGPRPGAQMQTAQPTLAELAQRAAAHPATAQLAPQFQMQDIAARQAQEAEARKPYNLRPGERRFGADGKVIAEGAPVAGSTPAAIQEYEFAKSQGFKGSMLDFHAEKARAGRQPESPASRMREVTLDDGVYAYDPADPSKRIRIGDRPNRNEGEGRDFTQETKLRGEYTEASKPFNALREHYTRLNAAYNQKDGPGDIAMVYSFMKMLDPTSVVREGEFATAQNAGGIPDQIRQIYNRAMQGERLPDAVRTGFLQQGAAQFDGLARNQLEIENRYRGLAGQYKVDPMRAVPDVFGSVARPDPSKPFQFAPPAPPTSTQKPQAKALPQGWSIELQQAAP